MSENGVEHPLEAETVVEFEHPDDEIGQSEGAIWDCWSTDEGWIYEVLDLNFEKVRINAEAISEVHDDELRADGGTPQDGVERSEAPAVTCEQWGEDSLYPLHEEWADGEIEGREYRILRSLQGPHILVEFEDMDRPVAFELGDLLKHAHAATNGGDA